MTTILLADDHPIVRQGLRSLLEAEPGWTIVAEATDGLSAVDLIEQFRPHVAIVDVMLPDLNGLEVVRRAMRHAPETRVIVLSMHADEPYVLEALRGGAMAYVLKATSTTSLIEAIREVMTGRRYLSPPLTQHAIDAYLERANAANQPFDRYELLTPREREVLQLAAQGTTNAEIAERLVISIRTVETHRTNLMRKLELRTAAGIKHFASMRGLVT
jgi:DNA-binding NarL/FixJ family response regulator